MKSLIEDDVVVDFMSGSAMIFSGFAILANELREEVKNLSSEVLECKQDGIQWSPLSLIALDKGLTKDAIRKQLQNGDFEDGVDFKRVGNKIVVHQGAIGKIRRQRRSHNG